MIDDAFGILSTHLDMTSEEEILFKRIQNDFIHSRLITPDGEVYQVHKGVPSGNPFTSLIGSMVNLILAQYMWIRITGKALPVDRVLILGDDVVIGSDSYIPLSKLASSSAELGFTLSVEKSKVGHSYRERDDQNPLENGVHFLGHTEVAGRLRRSEKEVVQRMVYPERHKKRSTKESMLRFYSYIPDSLEGFVLWRLAYDNPDIMVSVQQALRDIGTGVDLASYDLPGRLRMLLEIQDENFNQWSNSFQGEALFMVGAIA